MAVITETRILVEVLEKAEKTDGGIFIPEAVHKKEAKGSFSGTVLELGTELQSMNGLDFRKGSRIVFPRYAGVRLFLKNEPRHLRIMHKEDVLAVLEKDEEAEI